MIVTGNSKPTLSIVIPAYNESERLPASLGKIERFLHSSKFDAEIIIVDDGSTDGTAEAVRAAEISNLRVLRISHRGKAQAVRVGMLAANGEYILFTDADLSTPIDHVATLIARVEQGADVAIGSREGSGAERVGEPGYRHFMGRVFNVVVQLLVLPGIRDSQCGFKLFRHDVAHAILERSRLYQNVDAVRGPRVTAFDVELLYIARNLGYTVVEVPTRWTHTEGSKVHPILDSVRMFADVARVKVNALKGYYDPPDG